MGEPSPHTLVERLERLERENRWWRLGCLLSLLIVTAVFVMGQSPGPKTVEATRFIVKDSKGKVRAVLGSQWAGVVFEAAPAWNPDHGQQGLHFYDSDGAYRAGISEDDDAKAWQMQLRGQGTPTAARLSVSDGLAYLRLDATEQSRAAADRDADERRRRLKAAKSPEEREKVFWRGMKGDGVTAALSAFPKGTSSHGLGGGLSFYFYVSRDGKVIWKAP